MLCPKCKQNFDTRFCPNCGYSPESAEGLQPPHAPEPPSLDDSQTIPQQYAGYQPPPIIINNNNTNTATAHCRGSSLKHKWVAFLLGLFLGVFGAHRFYTGKIGTGILYFLTMGFGGIGVVIDLIMILMGSFTDKQGNFLV